MKEQRRHNVRLALLNFESAFFSIRPASHFSTAVDVLQTKLCISLVATRRAKRCHLVTECQLIAQ